MGFQVGDSVRSLTDPHVRSIGTVVEVDAVRHLLRVRWSGVGQFEMVFEDEVRLTSEVPVACTCADGGHDTGAGVCMCGGVIEGR